MKKNVLLIVLTLFFGTLLYAQEKPETPAAEPASEEATAPPKDWTFSLVTGFTSSQAYYSNWSAGGDNSMAFRAFLTTGGNFAKNRHSFSYFLDLALGYQWLFSNPAPLKLKKTDDRLNLNLNYGYQMSRTNDNFFYSAFVNFRTQFGSGFNDDRSVLVSRFMAPGYLIYGLGVAYKLKDFLTINISPLSARHVFVLNDSIWRQENYGITAEDVAHNRRVVNEFGAYFNAFFQKDLTKSVNLMSQLTLFSNYLDKPQNIVVTFDLGFNFKITKFLSSGVTFGYVYDDNVRFDVYGTGRPEDRRPKSQFMQSYLRGINVQNVV